MHSKFNCFTINFPRKQHGISTILNSSLSHHKNIKPLVVSIDLFRSLFCHLERFRNE